MTTQAKTNNRRGRPRSIERIEANRGVKLEHLVMEMAASERITMKTVAHRLRISVRTLRDALNQRGYRIRPYCQLERISPPDPAESRTASAAKPVAPGAADGS